jgi:acetyltransferase-like isoleucine patch superfamily enzyme
LVSLKMLHKRLRKYDFPLQIWAAFDKFLKVISVFLCTMIARTKLSCALSSVGTGLIVDGLVVIKVRLKHSIQIGKNVKLFSRYNANLAGMIGPILMDTRPGGCINVGDNSGLSSCVLSSRSSIVIGKNVKVGANVKMFDHDFHSLNFMDRRNHESDKKNCATAPITIEDDVFVGANAIILKGVHVGTRSVVGAGAVVTLKEIPPGSMVVGNPAKIIKNIL